MCTLSVEMETLLAYSLNKPFVRQPDILILGQFFLFSSHGPKQVGTTRVRIFVQAENCLAIYMYMHHSIWEP